MISRHWQAPGIEYDNTYFVFILGWSIISIRLMIQQSESSTCVSIFIHRCLVSNSEAGMGSFNHPTIPHSCVRCTWTSRRLKRFNPTTPSAFFLFFIPCFFSCFLCPSFSDAAIRTEITVDSRTEPRNQSQSPEGNVWKHLYLFYFFFLFKSTIKW